MIVVKIGGSLYDHPQLGPGLRAYLATLDEPALLVPGGGPFADAIRDLDRTHNLSEEASHWLALRSLDAAAEFLCRLTQATVLDPFSFAVADEANADHLPHTWTATSDSLAARVAIVKSASRLVLLKSIDIPPDCSWHDAATRGWVDAQFPDLVAKFSLRVEAVNFRRWLC